jgi:hypothetical protein
MSLRRVVSGSLAPILALLPLAFPAAPARAQGAAWNQDRVTELAVELAQTVAELQSAFRREPVPHLLSGQARARHRFRDALRVLRTETRALASELESGAGFEETLPIARRSGVVIRELRREGRRMAWREPVVGHARRAEELIAELAPFYVDRGGDAASDADAENEPDAKAAD